MPAPCDKRSDHQRHVMLCGRRHQVAQMVADDVFHLPVRQHTGLGPPGGAGGVEEPRRMIMCHVRGDRHRRAVRRQRIPLQHPRPDRNLQLARGVFRLCRHRMIGECGIEDVHRGTGRCCEIRHLRRGQAEIRRHPHRAEHPRCEHRLKNGVGVARVQQHPVAVLYPARGQSTGRHLDPVGKLRPGPGAVTPDQCRPAGKASRALQQQMREIACRDQRRGSRIDT